MRHGFRVFVDPVTFPGVRPISRASSRRTPRDADADEQAGQRVEHGDPQQRGDRGDKVRPGDNPNSRPSRCVYARYSSTKAGMSTSSITAAITIAASVASGRSSNSLVRAISVRIVSAATISPESWVRAPRIRSRRSSTGGR
jgi:hypothetical protein